MTAALSIIASVYPIGASASPDPTMAGFDYLNKYLIPNSGYPSDV